MIPSRNLLRVLSTFVLLSAIPVWLPYAITFWWFVIGMLSIVLIADAASVIRSPQLTVQRRLSNSLPLGVWCDVVLHISNRGSAQRLEVFDHHPASVTARGLPQHLYIQARAYARFRYQVHTKKRGEIHFPYAQIRYYSKLRLWRRNINYDLPSTVRVYPNFAVITKYLLLATDNRLSQMGIRKHRRRGEGQDFHQLREYREGDALRQIDWKATSRMQKLISREYQDERDQEIMFLIDCGQRMLAQDGELSHFDHCLNAVLLLAYVALRQGDAVGLATFSGDFRWLSARKGITTINQILNTVYDLQPSTSSPDYSSAVLKFLKRQTKRSLVIVVSNLRDEDSDDMLPALTTLKRRHLVLLASMQESIVKDTLSTDVHDFDDALRLAAAHEYVSYRKQALDQLHANGVLNLDVTPDQLSVGLVNRYLDIKASGLL